jgi:hypothetical protein
MRPGLFAFSVILPVQAAFKTCDIGADDVEKQPSVMPWHMRDRPLSPSCERFYPQDVNNGDWKSPAIH